MAALVDQNDTMVSGDDKSIVFTCYEEDGVTTVNVSGATAVTWALGTGPSATPTLTKTLAAGQIAVSGSLATVTLDAIDTAALSGKCYHELQLIDDAGDTFTGAKGYITIKRDMIT